ncbi:MAG: hypothetical protein LiPW15_608 [Parcubacteria group bacterium LiPW_15]|nr:MAG: hypothetical protein LiPW15_608 [Parcubacteria group bacterium LiPW_15]
MLMPAKAAAERLTHESRIRIWLMNGSGDLDALTESVHYFLTGPGREVDLPWCSHSWEFVLSVVLGPQVVISEKDRNRAPRDFCC